MYEMCSRRAAQASRGVSPAQHKTSALGVQVLFKLCDMEGNQWTAPVWPKCGPRKEGRRRDLHYSYPDWGNIGPATATPAQYKDLQMQSSRTPSRSCFTTVKDVQKEFPLRTTCAGEAGREYVAGHGIPVPSS
ncbi:hypothetical protein O3P69_002227 [Scylla paramamosain]|uniref:Uncharacterized protein n=1 Tax=Scylla paramamosain TaxID=85552 RepID=A0AAW0V7F6_SCYPA